MVVAADQGSGEMINSVSVLAMPKEKVSLMKWISTVHGKEVVVKYQVKFLTIFSPCNIPAKTECAEDIDFFWHKKRRSQ